MQPPGRWKGLLPYGYGNQLISVPTKTVGPGSRFPRLSSERYWWVFCTVDRVRRGPRSRISGDTGNRPNGVQTRDS